MKIHEILFLVVLFLVGTFLWTLPIQEDTLPFGEADSAWHFANGDYAAKTDKVFSRLPFYISAWYYDYNKILGPDALEYPPPYHVGYAIFQIIGGERFVPVYILIAISSFFAAFSVYLLLRKLYGFPTAILASTAMMFSFREIMVYLWGQRPTILSFAFTPLILYACYKYLESYYSGDQKAIYLYITGILFILQFLVHPQGAVLSLIAILIYVTIQSIRKKKFPISKKNVLHIGALLILVAIIAGPFITIYTGADSGVHARIQITDLYRLFDWMDISTREGYPNSMGGPPVIFYNMDKVYFPYYHFVVWLGIIYLIIKREDKDILILSWLLALYISIHLDVLGVFEFGRLSRMLMGETVLFYSIMAIGLVGVVRLFTKEKSKIPLIVTAILFIALISYNGVAAYNRLSISYPYPLRISLEQYEFAQWMDENLPEDAYFYSVGVLTYPKFRFISMLSHRPGIWMEHSVDHPWITITHILIDYSDAVRINDQGMANNLKTYEQQFIDNNVPLVYDKNNIKLYAIR